MATAGFKISKKMRGKIHPCCCCGETINIGDIYCSWLDYHNGKRATIYVHRECHTVLDALEAEMPAFGSCARPKQGVSEG